MVYGEDEDFNELTPYEIQVRAEVERWHNEKASRFMKALNAAGIPVEWGYEKIPESTRQTVESAVMGSMEMLKDGARWTYSNNGILKEARKIGLEVDNHHELRDCDLEKLDQLARRYFGSNKIVAALEGAGCGWGGIALVAADVPLLFTVSFRAVQQIGSCYGFDMEDPNMLPIVMGIFNAGSAASSTAKAGVLADARVAALAFSKNWPYEKVAKYTFTGIVARTLKERTKHLPKDIANNVTKRKLAQTIPFLGAAVGAGFNYWFMSNTVRAAYMVFREMYLERKHGTFPQQT